MVRPSLSAPASFVAEEQIIAGNVILYGATGGEALIRGVVGERFAVRNSGRGRGGRRRRRPRVRVHDRRAGRGARPDRPQLRRRHVGGVAFVWDPDRRFGANVNSEMVDLEDCDDEDVDMARRCCSSATRPRPDPRSPSRLLGAWPRSACQFVKVMPRDYRRVLEAMREAEAAGIAGRRSDHGGRPWVSPPGSSRPGGSCRSAGRCPCACGTGSEVYEPFPKDRLQHPGVAGAWTAASRSATTAARSATSSPTGTTWSTGTTGRRPSSGCTPPTTSPSSPAGCARRPARRRACSASTPTR